jgi:hypothetical protein
MKRYVAFFSMAIMVSVVASARTHEFAVPVAGAGAQMADSTLSVDQILEKFITAIGGQSAIQKQTTRVMKGSAQLTSTGEMGTIEIYEKAPDKALYTVNIPSNGPGTRAYDGKAGWVLFDPDEGPQDVSAGELPALKRRFDFYRELRLKALYPRTVLKGKENVGGQEANVIEATADDGLTERWYFAAQTGLLVRSDTPYVTDDGTSFVQTLYEDYREVDGVKIPFVWRQTSPDFDYLITFTEIQNNVPIDDSKFAKPSGQ